VDEDVAAPLRHWKDNCATPPRRFDGNEGGEIDLRGDLGPLSRPARSLYPLHTKNAWSQASARRAASQDPSASRA